MGTTRMSGPSQLSVKAVVTTVVGALALLGCSGGSSRSAPTSPATDSSTVHLCTGQTTSTSVGLAVVHMTGPPSPPVAFVIAERSSNEVPIAVGANGITIDVVATMAHDPVRHISDAAFDVANSASGQTVHRFALEQPWSVPTHIVHLVWDGRDDAGHTIGSGSYFLKVHYKVAVDHPITCADGSGDGVERGTAGEWGQSIADLAVS
jgi:hypothetical protein